MVVITGGKLSDEDETDDSDEEKICGGCVPPLIFLSVKMPVATGRYPGAIPFVESVGIPMPLVAKWKLAAEVSMTTGMGIISLGSVSSYSRPRFSEPRDGPRPGKGSGTVCSAR